MFKLSFHIDLRGWISTSHTMKREVNQLVYIVVYKNVKHAWLDTKVLISENLVVILITELQDYAKLHTSGTFALFIPQFKFKCQNAST